MKHIGGAAVALLFLFRVRAQSKWGDPVIAFKDATIHGIYQPDTDTDAFLGIKYGVAHRFEEPYLLHPSGKIDAQEHGPACPSMCDEYVGTPYFCESRPARVEEDCLYLHVWVPSVVREKKTTVDVIAMIHGGSFLAGTSGSKFNDGAAFANALGKIVVGFNYRLALFGAIAADWAPGNLHLQDQTLALEWIHNYINYFGGLTDSVTLLGFSAGATSTICHLASDNAGVLFHKAIAVSTPCCSFARRLDRSKSQTRFALGAVFKECGNFIQDAEAYKACLKGVPLEKMKVASLLGSVYPALEDLFLGATPWSPVIDGKFITEDCFEKIKKGWFNTDVPLMYTVSAHEGPPLMRALLYAATRWLPDQLRFWLTNFVLNRLTWSIAVTYLFGEDAYDVLQGYPPSGVGEPAVWGLMPNQPDTASSFVSLFGDHRFLCAGRYLCAAVNEKGGRCHLGTFEEGWSYAKDEKLAEGNDIASYGYIINRFCSRYDIRCHLEEKPWMLQNAGLYLGKEFRFTPEEQEAVYTYHRYLESFVETGIPDVDKSLPEWPPYTWENDAWQVLSILSESKAPPGRALSTPGYFKDKCDRLDAVFSDYSVPCWKDLARQSVKRSCGPLNCPPGTVCIQTANVDSKDMRGKNAGKDFWAKWMSEEPFGASQGLSLLAMFLPRYACVSKQYRRALQAATNMTYDAPLSGGGFMPGESVAAPSRPTRRLAEGEGEEPLSIDMGGMRLDIGEGMHWENISPNVLGNLAAIVAAWMPQEAPDSAWASLDHWAS
ncbi:unnamed protein product [Vitrella brassicaformis CCMP3155]|uniref:Carboxylesterase type B domain-containing protein n=2 Tax=Vitrella brassicaformis TaxID=1169539 RepID=A0A0G4GSQ3_VITBC|nr:unnamed protein product [Vitrella brassicaformis CCMP3155]|mmetsp:Transcript_27953/g.69779  ORF Transcript_27953/g.69779 Transcript_27953/m.69779 type:complete len:774 (+) Transcript_27953:23-2344(+)|eukprot:CEM33724.1 unnamed protein product [Vitrella brassicaformis CCMP3155]